MFCRYLSLSVTFAQQRVTVIDRRITFTSVTFVQALNGATFGGQFACNLRSGLPIQANVEYDVINDFLNCSTVNGGFRFNSFATTVGRTTLYYYTGYNRACGVLYGPSVDPLDSSDTLEADTLSVGGRAFVRIGEPDCELGVDCFAVSQTPGICDSAVDRAYAEVTFSPLPFTVTDPDGIDNSNFIFTIISGNDGSFFVINSVTGVLTLVRALDRDQGIFDITLIVQVTDRVFSDTFSIAITVEDRNDNPPVPVEDPIIGRVDEGAPVSTEVAAFNFTDLDDGVNAELMYIVSGAGGDFLIPDSTVGLILSGREFDYDAGDRFFNFTVIAADGGTPSLIGSATVEITVTDLNDNAPVIVVDVIPGVVYVENGEPVSPALVTVTDADSDSFPLLYAVIRIYDALNGEDEILNLTASLPSGFRLGYYNNTLVIVGAGDPGLYSLLLSQVTYENTAVLFETPLERTLIYGVCDQLVSDTILSVLSVDSRLALTTAGASDSSLPFEDATILISSCRELVVDNANLTLEDVNDRPTLVSNETIEFPDIQEDQPPESIRGACVGDLFSEVIVDTDRVPFLGIAIVGHGSSADPQYTTPGESCRSSHANFGPPSGSRSCGRNYVQECPIGSTLSCDDSMENAVFFHCLLPNGQLRSNRCTLPNSGRKKRQAVTPSIPDPDDIVRAELYLGVGSPIDITTLFTTGSFIYDLQGYQQQCNLFHSNVSYYSFTLINGSTVQVAIPPREYMYVDVGSVNETSAILLGPTSAIRWVPIENQVGISYLTYKAWDGSNHLPGDTGVDTTIESDTSFSLEVGNATVEVVAVNDAPVIELGGSGQLNYSNTYTEGGPSVFVASRNARVVEFDSTDLTLFDLRVRISAVGGNCNLSNYDGVSTDRLYYLNDTEIPLTYSMSLTGQACVEYTFEGEMSIDQWRAIITTIRFRVEDDEPSDHTRQISFIIRDSTLDSDPSYTLIDVTLVSDVCPALTLPGSSPVTHAEHGGPTVLDDGIIVTDADRDPVIRSASVAILSSPTNNPCTGCELSATTGSTGISVSFNSTTLVLTLSGPASPEEYQQVLRTVAFEDTGSEPSFNLVDVRFSVFDPTVSPCTGAMGDLSVMVEHLNDNSPDLYLDYPLSQDYTAVFTEGDGTVRLTGAEIFIMDLDGLESDVYHIVVEIEQGCISTEDRLEFQSGHTPSTVSIAYDTSSCSLTLVGSRAALETDLPRLRYRNVDIDNPTPTQRVLNFTITDGTLESTFSETILTIVAVNDAPVIDLDVDNLISSDSRVTFILGTTSVRITGPMGASIQDPDNTNLFGMVLLLSEFDANGNRVSSRSDSFFESIQSNNPNLPLSFGLTFSYISQSGELNIAGTTSIANYVAVLNDLLYSNNRFPPTENRREISVQVSDGDSTSAMAFATIVFAGELNPPVLDLNGNEPGSNVQETYVITTPPLVLFPNTFLTDVDGDHICTVNVTLSGPDSTCLASSVSFESAFSDITVDVNDVGGGAMYSLYTSFADCREAIVFQAVLRGITFSVPDSASPGMCEISLYVTDARSSRSNIAIGTVEVRAFNARPFIDLDLGLSGRDYSTVYFQGGRIQHIVSIFDPATARNITDMTVIGEADGEAPFDDGTIYHGVVILEESNAGYTLTDVDSPVLDYLQVSITCL